MKTFATFFCSFLFMVNLSSQDPHQFHVNSFLKPGLGNIREEGFPFSLFSAHSSLVQSGIQIEKLDSSHYWEWNYSGNHWDLVSRSFYTDDPVENSATRLELLWRNGQWENRTLDSTIYNASHQPVYVKTFNWDGINWINSVLITYMYDTNHDLTDLVMKLGDGSGWENFISIQSTYDSNHHLLAEKYGLWMNNQWDFSQQALYTYNANHKLNLSVYQILVSGQWNDNTRELYTYDMNDKIKVKLTQKVVAGEWNDWSQILYGYNGLSRNLISQEFTNGNWENQSHYFETSNSNQNILSRLDQFWQLNWVNQDSSQYYYSDVTASPDLMPSDAGISIYPNPAQDIINIQFEEKINQEVDVKIYSIPGIKMLETKINPVQPKPIDIRQLVPGTYLIMIQNLKAGKIFVKQ